MVNCTAGTGETNKSKTTRNKGSKGKQKNKNCEQSRTLPAPSVCHFPKKLNS
jgi:hypothetical protein